MPELLDLYGSTGKLLRLATDAALRRHGLRLGQDRLLAALWAEDGRTPGDIADAVNVTTPAVTKAATVLEKAGLLVRRPDSSDNRLVRLWLTAAGRDLREPVQAERRRLEQQITTGLTPAEREQFVRVLAKISNAAAGLLEMPGAGEAALPVREKRSR